MPFGDDAAEDEIDELTAVVVDVLYFRQKAAQLGDRKLVVLLLRHQDWNDALNLMTGSSIKEGLLVRAILVQPHVPYDEKDLGFEVANKPANDPRSPY